IKTNRANLAHGRLPSMWFASAKPPYGTLDAAEWAPSTASKADIRAAKSYVRFIPKADMRCKKGMSALGRFCCKSPLRAFLVSDSVAVRRFATGAGYDGAADTRPGTVFLFISSR